MLKFILIGLAGCCVSWSTVADRGGRLAPPSAVDCERDHLTSYEGIPVSVTSTPDQWTVTLRTDWDSEEHFTVATDHPQLVNGEPWKGGDPSEFVDRNGIPHDSLRVIAWVCDQPERVTLDWRPAAK